MADLFLTRRALGVAVTGLVGLAALDSRAGSASVSTDTQAPLRRFMKVYASLNPGPIWYWYSGVIEMARPDAPIAPLIGIDTLIRRDVSLNAAGDFSIVTCEAGYFHSLEDRRPLNYIANPVTGRTVEPLHFSEGPRTTIWSDQSLVPREANGVQTSVAWRSAGPYTWLYRTLHADVPHPLDMKKWPLESSGARNRSGSFSTHCALTRDLMDPALPNAPCSFAYEAIFGWFPWLLMGQRPGYLFWRATGLKLPGLEDLPAESRKGFEGVFPAMFSGVGFGRDGGQLWEQYQARHSPAFP